ncbi:hypothetical protein V8G54_018267 [Vigna mungo]|uniref:RING-type E3 ubiquitin transferase n=1 Tax=Vigna mungo TaxID=3915 RepID=A0AAQ3RUK6_VIGMU
MAETDPSWVLRNLTRVSTQISYLSSFKPIIRTQCCDLARRIRFLAPLFLELHDNVELTGAVALVTTQFRRAKEQFDPLCLQLYGQLLSVYNQSYDVNTQTAELRSICEKLQFINVDDVKQESLALEKMGGERIQDMSLVVLKKIQDFLMVESGNIIVSPSEDISRHTDESYVKSCTQSLVIPDEFRCPISLELMKDPVIICTGQTYERSCIKKWLEAGHGTCPKTQQILSTPILIPNHALYGLISSWCEANGVEPPKRLGNLWLCKTTSDGSSELVDLDILVSKLSSRGIEDRRNAVGEHCMAYISSFPLSLSLFKIYWLLWFMW